MEEGPFEAGSRGICSVNIIVEKKLALNFKENPNTFTHTQAHRHTDKQGYADLHRGTHGVWIMYNIFMNMRCGAIQISSR